VDGEELADLNTEISGRKYHAFYHETTKTRCAKHPAVPDEERTEGKLVEPGEFSRFDLHKACWEYIHSSVNASLGSENPLIASLAVLNEKVGKTRLRKMQTEKPHPLTKALLDVRMKAEVIT